jgi:hypothetical protein
MNDDVTLADIQLIREMFMEVFVEGGYNPALCSVDEDFNAKLEKSVCASQFAGLKGGQSSEPLGIILLCADNKGAQIVVDITRTFDALQQGKTNTVDNPLLKSVKKVTGDFPSMYSAMDDIIIFIEPQQWKKFLEAEKRFVVSEQSRAEALELLKKCWNAGDTRGA